MLKCIVIISKQELGKAFAHVLCRGVALTQPTKERKQQEVLQRRFQEGNSARGHPSLLV